MGKTQTLLLGVKVDTLQPVTLLVGPEQWWPLYRLLPTPLNKHLSGGRLNYRRIAARTGSQKTALYQPHTAIIATQRRQHRYTQTSLKGAVI